MVSRFALVGGCGFIVDILTFNILIFFALDVTFARILAFWCAASVTWYGHRHVSFKVLTGSAFYQWLKHFSVCHVTGALSLAIFYLSYATIGINLSLILGIAVATILNFLVGKYFTFKRSSKSIAAAN